MNSFDPFAEVEQIIIPKKRFSNLFCCILSTAVECNEHQSIKEKIYGHELYEFYRLCLEQLDESTKEVIQREVDVFFHTEPFKIDDNE